MAIEIRRPTFYKISAVKEFTDRDEPRKAFWARYEKMCNEGSTIINFFGAGGVGKSALLKKIEEEIKHRDSMRNKQCKYIKYDFSIGTDTREVLRTFKFQLSNYGCNFPLFDIGDYYYSLKVGQDAAPPRTPTALEQIPLVKKLTKNLSKANSVSGSAMSVFNTTKILFQSTNDLKKKDWLDFFIGESLKYLGNAMPIMRTITTLMSVADMFLEEYLDRKGLLDEFHKSIRNELNALRQDKDPMAVYEYLPVLFAVDVGDWMEETKNKLVIFLDNYESLISVTSFITSEQLKRDLWLRGYNGLIRLIPNTLWTIAGRNKLKLDDDLAKELEQHLIGALSSNDSNRFLEKAGIKNSRLRNKLCKLTKGYPIFLDLCVNVYVEHKRQYNEEPTIEAFGKKHEEVVGRIFRYIDAAGATATKDMLEFLCVLNVWTDKLAHKIGRMALRNFSPNNYKLVKNFSFIRAENIENENISLKIYRFDKTIQSLLITDCDKFLIEDVRKIADDYFRDMFANKDTFTAEETFYFKLWVDLIVRFTATSMELSKRYKYFLSDRVRILVNDARFDAAEEILRLFMDKLENFKAIDTPVYIDFEMDLGWLRRAQGKYDVAYEIIKSAYEKRIRLYGEEHLDTVEAMHKLAILLSDLARHEEALTLRKKVLRLRQQNYGEEHPDTLKAMNNLAVSLSALGRHEEAVTRLEKLLELESRNFGKENVDTISVMNNLAISLRAVGRCEDAVTLHEKAFRLYCKVLGKKHPETIAVMNNLANSLRACDCKEEAAILQKKVLMLSKEILGKEHPNTITVMNNLAVSLNELGRSQKAMILHEKVLNLYEKILGEKHPNTLAAMNNLASSLRAVGRCEDATTLHEKNLKLCRQIFGKEHRDTLEVMNNLAISLCACNRHTEAIPLLEQLLVLQGRIHGEKNPEALYAMDNLASALYSSGDTEKAIELQEKALVLSREIFGNEAPYTLNAANNLAWNLTMSGHHAEAVAIVEATLPLCRRILGEAHIDTLGTADTLIHALDGLGRHTEALTLLKKSLEKCRENFGETHPLTIAFAQSLANMN